MEETQPDWSPKRGVCCRSQACRGRPITCISVRLLCCRISIRGVLCANSTPCYCPIGTRQSASGHVVPNDFSSVAMAYRNQREDEQIILNQLEEDQNDIDFIVLLCLDIEQQLLNSLPTPTPPRAHPPSQCLENRQDFNRSPQFSRKRERDVEQPSRRTKQRPTTTRALNDNSTATSKFASLPVPREPSNTIKDARKVPCLASSHTKMVRKQRSPAKGAGCPMTRAVTPSKSDNEKPAYPPRVNLFADHYQPHSACSSRPATPSELDIDKSAYPTRFNLFPGRYQRQLTTTSMAGVSGDNHKSDIVERILRWLVHVSIAISCAESTAS